MFGKLLTLALVSDNDFRDKYKPLVEDAIEVAREDMHLGSPENVGEIVFDRWFNEDDLYEDYPDLIIDILEADIDDAVKEEINND